MNNKKKEMTKYFRNAIAAQSNIRIDFKNSKYANISMEDLINGKINNDVLKNIFYKLGLKGKDFVNIIICPSILKTVFEENERVNNNIDELTGVYYIPAVINKYGELSFDKKYSKLPWFPREYLYPMVESIFAVGEVDRLDSFLEDNIGLIKKLESWSDYVYFFVKLYEHVSQSKFMSNTIQKIENASIDLENKIYIFKDETVNSTTHIMKLYDELMLKELSLPLYENFTNPEIPEVEHPVENNIDQMKAHCGQMGGEFSLSRSQRESVNHFNSIEEGEILAVNGPPGTGKTTLLQSIVADIYVKKAINEEKAPLIVATSTNNQAVTNIITSFKSIDSRGIFNLEKRWIEGVNSFATYFPSNSQKDEAVENNYQYTSQRGDFFVSEIENEENINNSKVKLINNCNEYFDEKLYSISECQIKLHEELIFLNNSKDKLLSIAQDFKGYKYEEEDIEQYICLLDDKIRGKELLISDMMQRIEDWNKYYKSIPSMYRMLKFINNFSRKIETKFRLFINEDEQIFLNERMSFDDIMEKYSLVYQENLKELSSLKKQRKQVIDKNNEYGKVLKELRDHRVVLHKKENERYNLNINNINELIDTSVRYMQFWIAVHYYECRWVSGEDELTKKQKGTNYDNVLNKFYNRLSMISPCLVMTFYMLPSQFLAYNGSYNLHLFNKIDLLIVDEAGQVSPEIAACSFSLAKKAIVVGDIYQLEPVWSINRLLDKTLALFNGVIDTLDGFDSFEESGLNCSSSSVMLAASKSCKYEKYGQRGLFLSEHRRCYDEIIDYCNQLVYNGKLEPMRGKGEDDRKLKIKNWNHMAHRQVTSTKSKKINGSRVNHKETSKISEWIKKNYEMIKDAYPKESEENLIGVITPFAAQAKTIRKQLGHYNLYKIQTGTVHTFQGAEKRIIILSTVYGSQDGCYFIDANENLMNVAVSRSKDFFFVFGDIDCLSESAANASGLLRRGIESKSITKDEVIEINDLLREGRKLIEETKRLRAQSDTIRYN